MIWTLVIIIVTFRGIERRNQTGKTCFGNFIGYTPSIPYSGQHELHIRIIFGPFDNIQNITFSIYRDNNRYLSIDNFTHCLHLFIHIRLLFVIWITFKIRHHLVVKLCLRKKIVKLFQIFIILLFDFFV